MKDIAIEFVNIQSHEHTMFSLKPGLNFILAEDNNVGKSTIFKVLLCAMQLPGVSSEDLDELVRGGCSQARATFKFDDEVITLWLQRVSGRATHAFFESQLPEGGTVRSLNAPQSLREAFDIVSSSDGKVVNFNDADSVQLIVQDTPKNDEVLAQVLVDVKVDAIKANAVRLSQQIQQDYKLAISKLDDVNHIVSTMNYIDSVDLFFEEKELLTVACRVADSVVEVFASMRTKRFPITAEEIQTIRIASTLYDRLRGLTFQEPKIVRAISDDLFDHLKTCVFVLQRLNTVESCTTTKPPKVTETQLNNMKAAVKVMKCLEVADNAARYAMRAKSNSVEISRQISSLLKQLEKISLKVKCPVKGEVFYNDKECIPISDGPSLRHGEE